MSITRSPKREEQPDSKIDRVLFSNVKGNENIRNDKTRLAETVLSLDERTG